MIDTFLSLLNSPEFIFILSVILIAGIVRGFSGFGTGMIIAPAVSAVYSPQTALVLIFIIDTIPAMPVVVPEMKRCNWRELIPIIVGTVLFIPFGLYVLKHGDETSVRWLITIAIFLAVFALWSGWKYKGPRGNFTSLVVGSISGFLGGAAALPGPPAILYWMASKLSTVMIRANTMVFLFLSDLLIGVGLFFGNMITYEAAIKGAVAAPIYLGGLLIGKKLFAYASEATYKRLAFAIILLSAIGSMPWLDSILRH